MRRDKDRNFLLGTLFGAGIMAVLVIAAILIVAAVALAQAPVQNVPTELRASQVCSEARGTGAQTATLTPPSGQYVYVQSLEAGAFTVGGTVAISVPASLTSTNLPGSITFGLFGATANTSNTAGTVYQNFVYSFAGNSLKSSAAGTAVTVVAPSVTNLGWHIALCGYFAP